MGVLAGLVKLCLCGTFLLSGVCKLTPKWGADVYAAMDEAFENRFTPFWQEMFFLSEIGVELNAAAVKLIFGSTEVLCAALLFTSHKFSAAIMLFGLMSAVVLTHLFLGEFAELPMPLVLCLSSLAVGFVGYSPLDQGKPKTG
ncbi:unnamed protein product [Ectocarpus sp. 13 AM-2016]